MAYDIHSNKLNKVRKTAKKYLWDIQKSVFEGELTQGQLNKLKAELERIIIPEEDGIVIYGIEWDGTISKDIIGTGKTNDSLIV